MRILDYFSFGFAAGALLLLQNLPNGPLLVLGALLLALVALGLIFRGKREKIAALLAAGILCGGIWTLGYDKLVLSPAQQIVGDNVPFSVELNAYPIQTDYGASVTGYVMRDGLRISGVVYLDALGDWKPGDVLSGTGNVRLAGQTQEDGQQYYRSVGIYLQVFLDEQLAVESAENIPIRYWPAVVTSQVKLAVAALFPEDVRGFFQALLAGDKSGISYQDKTALQIAGTYHTMAVSGMHVSILMSVLFFLTMKHRRIYPMLGLPLLIFYCIMMGGAPSVIRAAVMQLFLMAAPMFRRESDPPTAIGAALLVLVVANPCCLQNVGLQLSFGATVGIVCCSSRIYDALASGKVRKFRGLYIAAAKIASTTLGALLLTTPLMAYYYGTVSLLAVVTNMLVVQVITVCFSLGLFAVGAFFLSPGLGAVLAAPIILLMRYAVLISRLIAKIPFAAIYPDTPYLLFWLIFVYAMILLLVWRREAVTARLLLLGGCCAAITLCTCIWLGWAEHSGGTFTFTALDVGQGQCLLLDSQGVTAAIDCGGSRGNEAGELLARTMLTSGSPRLNYLILTHYDKDHTGGAAQLFSRIPVDVLLLPDMEDDSGIRQELEELACDYGTQVYYVREDLNIPFGAGTVQVFAPVSEAGGNESCLSILGTFGDYDILVTGDLGVAQEKQLLETHQLPDIELLVAGHHGSKYSTGLALLLTTAPELVMISVGDNSYGHPTDEVLTRIEMAGAAAYRTDLSGTITIRR